MAACINPVSRMRAQCFNCFGWVRSSRQTCHGSAGTGSTKSQRSALVRARIFDNADGRSHLGFVLTTAARNGIAVLLSVVSPLPFGASALRIFPISWSTFRKEYKLKQIVTSHLVTRCSLQARNCRASTLRVLGHRLARWECPLSGVDALSVNRRHGGAKLPIALSRRMTTMGSKPTLAAFPLAAQVAPPDSRPCPGLVVLGHETTARVWWSATEQKKPCFRQRRVSIANSVSSIH